MVPTPSEQTPPDSASAPPRPDQDRVNQPPGPAWSASWAQVVDDSIAGNLTTMPRSGGVTVVALGSYARRQLCPASDIDLLLLHDGWGKQDLQDLVQAVCYPLWDEGLSVGHAVMTAREAVRGCGEAIDRATSLTDRRLVTGDQRLLDDLAARTDRWLRRHRAGFVADLAAADAERHDRDGPEPGMLEPDLKNGAGGLRDLDSLRWAAAAMLGTPTLDALIGARYLAAAEHRQLREASVVLLETRCALHLALGASKPARGVDRLRLDVQDDVARVLGHESGDVTLRRVGLAMRLIRRVHDRTWPRLREDARAGRRRRRGAVSVPLGRDLMLVDGLVEVVDSAHVRPDSSRAIRTIAAAATTGTGIGRPTAELLSHSVRAGGEGAPAWSEASRAALLTLLRKGRRGLAAFADADHIGLFQALLPEWNRVRGHPQRNPYHRFDLDTHLSQSVAELVDIFTGCLDPRHAVIAERLAAPDVVLLGTWLHDIGKPWPGDHSIVGAERARQWVLHMGFGEHRADAVARLVRHHLLLPEVATSRDLDDPGEIRRVAELVGDTETLDGLLLLSLADARASGPSAWSAWKDRLLAELHARVRAHLTGGPAKVARIAGPDTVVDDAAELVGRDAVDRLLHGLHRRYLFAATAEQVAAHVQLVEDRSEELRAAWRAGPTDSTAVVSIVASDRRALVADCAGVIAGFGLAIHEARAFTRGDGVALDWFVVGVTDRTTGEPVAAHAVIDALHRLGHGRTDVAELVARRERRRDERIPATAPDVEVVIAPGVPTSRIEVRGPDSAGLLYRVAAALAAADLDLTGARITTLADEAREVFFVAGDALGDLEDLHDTLHAAAATARRPRSSV